jgi:tRNA(Ile)-lysidine synthase
LNTNEIIETVRRVIIKYTPLEGAVLNVALSGGSDSIALACTLVSLRKEFSFTLRALTVNYNLRGDESIRYRDFCESFCRENDIEWHCLEVDGKNLHEASENALRDIRYEWFETFDGFTLTAHTADDNAETFLLNLIRGSGLSGLTAIPERRGNFIRPLLSVKKSELLVMLNEIGQSFVTDSSNLTDDYTRNIIRNRVIPEIESFSGSFTDAAARLITLLRADNDFLEKSAEDFPDIASAPTPLRLRKLRKFFTHNNLSPDYNKISKLSNAIEDGVNAKISVGKDLYITYCAENREISLKNETALTPCRCNKIPMSEGDTACFCDKLITFSVINSENFSKEEIVNIKLTQNAFDYDIINSDIFVRLRENGDKYRRVNRNFDCKLKKLYTEFLSETERQNNILLCDNEGILWCEHFGCAERAKITENTKNIIIIKVDTV